jgi:outer membrane lipoprotein-sorting protein
MKSFTVIFILYLCSILIHAEDLEAEKLLNNLQKKFDSITDLSAEFKQSSSGKTNLSGKFFFKKENLLRLELKNIIIATDGETSWNYNKPQNRIIVSDYNESDPNIISLKRLVYDYPSQCSVNMVFENGARVLLLKPKEKSGLNFNSIKLWINSDNLVSKAVMDDPGTGIIEVEFSNYKINQKLSESIFRITPPEGSTVIDLR